MTDQGTRVRTIDIVTQGLAKRYRAERRFRFYGLSAILVSIVVLALLFISIIGNGYTAFWQTRIRLDVTFDPEVLQRDTLANADYDALVRAALQKLFPEVQGRQERRQLNGMISSGAAYALRDMALGDPDIIGKTVSVWVFADDDIDMIVKGQFSREVSEENRRISDQQLAWLDRLTAEGRVEKKFNIIFFRSGDSREPEQAGIWGAVMGSFFTLVITLLLSFPIGVAAAVYLEEFAHKNRWT
ncbi:MAG: DUF3333 domain-containing protein, partial [Desulfobacteraceae bacterium]